MLCGFVSRCCWCAASCRSVLCCVFQLTRLEKSSLSNHTECSLRSGRLLREVYDPSIGSRASMMIEKNETQWVLNQQHQYSKCLPLSGSTAPTLQYSPLRMSSSTTACPRRRIDAARPPEPEKCLAQLSCWPSLGNGWCLTQELCEEHHVVLL